MSVLYSKETMACAEKLAKSLMDTPTPSHSPVVDHRLRMARDAIADAVRQIEAGNPELAKRFLQDELERITRDLGGAR